MEHCRAAGSDGEKPPRAGSQPHTVTSKVIKVVVGTAEDRAAVTTFSHSFCCGKREAGCNSGQYHNNPPGITDLRAQDVAEAGDAAPQSAPMSARLQIICFCKAVIKDRQKQALLILQC